MRRLATYLSLAVPAIAGLLIVGCGGCSERKNERLSGGGATFIDPIMQKWSSEYNKSTGVEIDYTKSGSSDGIKKMIEKELEFGCSDAPMKKEQVTEAQGKGGAVVHVPLAMGGVAVLYNLPNIAELKLSGPVIAEIYLGKIKKWNDEAIAKLNPGLQLPDLSIGVVFRSEGSGTSNIFTEFLSKTHSEFAQKIGASTSPKWPDVGIGQKGSDGVANHVKEKRGTIGYAEVSFARKNDIAVASVLNRKGKFHAPDAAAVTAAGEWALNQQQTKEPYSLHELTYSLTDADDENAYPICGISYGLLYKKQPSKKGQALVAFLKWATTDGQKFATELHYAPLPGALGAKVADRLKQIEFGD